MKQIFVKSPHIFDDRNWRFSHFNLIRSNYGRKFDIRLSVSHEGTITQITGIHKESIKSMQKKIRAAGGVERVEIL